MRVDIGPHRPESLEVSPEAFPDEALPDNTEGHWLELIVASDELRTPERLWPLFLPKLGGSWVCKCAPDGAHRCKENEREPFVWVPLQAHKSLGKARLQLGLYYERNLLQSQLITTTIAKDERQIENARADTDYRITASLRELPSLPRRTLNILMKDNADYSHRLVLNHQMLHPVSYSLTEDQIGTAMKQVRQALVDIHLAVTPRSVLRSGRKYNLYDASNSKDLKAFKADLQELAIRGRELWAALAGDRASMRAQADSLVAQSSIQVARTSKSRLVFPWALVYDYPLEPGNRSAHIFCNFIDDWYDPSAPEREIGSQCPHADTHTLNTICPYGFWGLRHIIEQPPSMPPDRALPREILGRPTATMVVALSQDLRSDNHLKQVTAAVSQRVRLDTRTTRDAIKAALDEQPALEFLYFYCHGRHTQQKGSDSAQTYLEVGKKEELNDADLATWNSQWSDEHWTETSPLVIINGCHTTDMTPGALTTFVDAFANAYASGVIGTETTVHEDVAGEAAVLLLSHLCSGRDKGLSVGEAIRRMRFRLLSKGNLMGLTYTAYCSASLELTGLQP